MPLINCEVHLILTWSKDCVITSSTGEEKFAITQTKLYVPVVTLSIKDLATKTDYNTKITGIESKLNNHDHDKHINTSEFNKLAADVFNVRIALKTAI